MPYGILNIANAIRTEKILFNIVGFGSPFIITFSRNRGENNIIVTKQKIIFNKIKKLIFNATENISSSIFFNWMVTLEVKLFKIILSSNLLNLCIESKGNFFNCWLSSMKIPIMFYSC